MPFLLRVFIPHHCRNRAMVSPGFSEIVNELLEKIFLLLTIALTVVRAQIPILFRKKTKTRPRQAQKQTKTRISTTQAQAPTQAQAQTEV